MKELFSHILPALESALREVGVPENATVRIEVPTDNYEPIVTLEDLDNPDLEQKLVNRLMQAGILEEIVKIVAEHLFELPDEMVLHEKPKVILAVL